MAIPTIHPGEHLAEELKELNMSAAALARQIKVPTNRITGINGPQRAARNHGRHRPAFGPFLRHERGVLAESAEDL